jgi:predicted GNAT family acetyltransferase
LRQNAGVNVENDSAHQRFFVRLPEGNGELQYRRIPTRTLELVHTEVAPTLRGRGVGDALAEAAMDYARAEKLSIVATCPFVRRWLEKHPEHQHLVVASPR